MKKKNIVKIVLLIIIIILVAVFFVYRNAKEEAKEYEIVQIPSEEYAYFVYKQDDKYGVLNKEGNIVVQAQFTNVKIPNPLKAVFVCYDGENTKVLKTYTEGDCVVLDLSKEFLNYSKEDTKQKQNMIDSIVNTLTELTEVNSVKFMIDGQSNEEFKDIYTRRK